MSKPADTDDARSPALLLWILNRGIAQLHDVVKHYIRHLQQILLPRVLACLKQLPALNFAPRWRRARDFLVTLVHRQVAEYCYAIVTAWLKQYQRLRHSLDSCQPQQPQEARKDESISATQEPANARSSGDAEEAMLAQHSIDDSTAAATIAAAQQPAEAASSSPEAEAASSSTEAKAASSSPGAVAGSNRPGTEAASSGPGAEAASSSPEAEAISSNPEAEAASSSPGAEADSNCPGTEAASSGPGTEAANRGPKVWAASSSPGAEASSSSPKAEAASSSPEAETTSSSPEVNESESSCPTWHTLLDTSCPALANGTSSPARSQSAAAGGKSAVAASRPPAAGGHAAVASGSGEDDAKDLTSPRQVPTPDSASAGKGAKSCLSPGSISDLKLPKEEEVQIEAGQQQLRTPTRRERLKGSWSTAAAWLQSQATSAAALSASHPLSETSAAASSVAIPPYTSSSFSQQVSLGKHRRHASTTDLVIPDPDIPSSPQSRVHATGRSGFALEAASASFHSKVLRSGADAGRADIAAEYKPATSAPVSGQESLDKAAAALRSLRDKFGQKKRKEGLHANPTLQSAGQVTASSGSSFLGFSQDVSSGCSPVADMVSSTPSNRAAAVPSTTRSTFDFKTAVGGKTVLAGKSADTSRHVGSVDKQDSGHRHLNEEEHSAHNQVGSTVQSGLHSTKQKKCRPLQISGESTQAMDVYNLQSPGLVLLDQALPVVQTPKELERRNDSYSLALKQRGVTLKPWSAQHAGQQDSGHSQDSPDLPDMSPEPVSDGQVLEGQGRGQFLGPPAQRWAIGSALKDSMNRLPSVPEGFEDSMGDEERLAQAPLHAYESPCGTRGAATGRDSINAHLSGSKVHSKPRRHVTFAVSRVQEYSGDQENVQV